MSVYLQGVCIPVGCDYGVSAPARRGPCACRRLLFSSENTPLDFWNMYVVDFVISERFQGPLVNKIKIWIICSNDYARKTRIEILYKKTCCIAPNHFPKSDFSSNSWILRTLV